MQKIAFSPLRTLAAIAAGVFCLFLNLYLFDFFGSDLADFTLWQWASLGVGIVALSGSILYVFFRLITKYMPAKPL